MWKKRPTTSPPKTRENITLDEWKETWMGKNARQLHFHIGQREKEHRRIENAALSTGERDTYDEVPLQRFPVSTLRRNNDRRRILNP